ncbi:MAG: 5-formyltetrahydrofolate cyclo-ligase [Lachnospiraceae bacterium]
MYTKKEIRKLLLERRDSMEKDEKREKSAMVCRKLLETKAYKEASAVLCFVSYASEVDTFSFLQECLKNGKLVYVPKVVGTEMHFYQMNSLADLGNGYKGIPEPVHENNEFVVGEHTDALLIMPGVAFDMCGNRVGYGKGFYDRFLSKGFRGIKIAICFDFQILGKDTFPVEETDIKPDFLLSEKQCINLKEYDDKFMG